MRLNQKDFAYAESKSADSKLPVGGWRLYAHYDLWERMGQGDYIDDDRCSIQRYAYVQARITPPELWFDPGSSGVEVYAPLRTTGLFLEFARLFGEDRVWLDGAAEEKVLDWANTWGVLGRHATYPTRDGGTVSGRLDDREDVIQFVRLSVEAGRCLGLFEAARARREPDVDRLRSMGVRGDTAKQVQQRALKKVEEAIDKHLEAETYMRQYRRNDGTTFRGPAFHSLLGALYIQFSNLYNAPEEDIKFCRWCGAVIHFVEGELPPSDTPKGTRGKHKTHRNRDFCEEKHGVENWCKNKWHSERRRKLAAMGVEDAMRGVYMPDNRPLEWAKLTSSEKKVYGKAYRRTKKAA